ncbi:MAG: FHA domain-containing protein [Chlamydiales bacterium]
MIRLTINANSKPEIHLFNKSIILIGADASQVDLLLTEAFIQPIHLKMIEQNGIFFAINQANDPFVSINEHPFGKKLLQNGDVIQIHQIEIRFENLSDLEQEQSSNFPILDEQKSPALASQREETGDSSIVTAKMENLLKINLPFDEEVEALKEEEIQQGNLNTILREIKPFQEKQMDHFSHSKLEEAAKKPKSQSSLKDDYLRDLEDDNSEHSSSFESSNEPSHLYDAWKLILLFIFSALAVSGIAGTLLFYTLSGKTEAQETKAAQGVADIAMALTRAQLYHIKPHNQNWSDIEFLKSNLQAILPNTNSHASQIDAQGQFNCCPYSLRIYTNSDLSRFLLIAQPAPGLFNWLIPKSIIVLDSASMELRTFTDVRSINRALANPEPLDRMNGIEIAALVKQGKLIRLSVLANESGNLDFAPPKNIAWIQPGAENYIYNAPRYHRLGESLLQKAMNLSTSKGTGQEVTTLKQEVANFSRLNHLILYSNSSKSASQSKHSLMLFAPSDQFLFGYLLFNNQGSIHEVHLLKEEGEIKEAAQVEHQDGHSDIIAMETIFPESVHHAQQESNENLLIDLNHPIYIQLHALVAARENELRPLSAGLFSLLSQELNSPKVHFQTEFQNLCHTYLMTNSHHKQTIKETIMALYHQYEDMPIDQFAAFIKYLHLNHLIHQKDQTLSLIDENCIHNLENIFAHMEKCQSFLELDNLIHTAFTWLSFDYLKDPRILIKYQNLLRNHVLDQLEAFLLTEKRAIPLKLEDKEALNHILNHERVIKPDEKEFFWAEASE